MPRSVRARPYLVVNRRGTAKIYNRANFTLQADQVAFRLDITLPVAAFEKREQVLKVTVSEDQIIATPIELEVDDVE